MDCPFRGSSDREGRGGGLADGVGYNAVHTDISPEDGERAEPGGCNDHRTTCRGRPWFFSAWWTIQRTWVFESQSSGTDASFAGSGWMSPTYRARSTAPTCRAT